MIRLRFLLATLLLVSSSAYAADANEELFATDRAFSDLSAARGRQVAFTTYAAEDAVMFRPGGPPYQGGSVIREIMSHQGPGTLTWKPEFASAAASADLGYTWGQYEFRLPDSPKVYTGYYVSIWKKQADGKWKFVVDIGNDGPDPDAKK